MAVLPSTGFPATAYPILPPHSDNMLRQFDPDTLPIGRPGDRGYGGRSAIDPTSASHM
jgi:hypothetical protein